VSAKVLVVGLDAMEVDFVDQFVAEGRMPTFARLADSAAQLSPSTPLDTLPGAIWPELNTGLAGWRTALFFHPRQLHTGEADLRPLTESAVDGEAQYWVRAARAGKRVLAADLPQIVLVPDLPTAVQIREWGVHDRQWSTRSEPPEALREIVDRWGPAPFDLCDNHHHETREGYRSLRDALLEQATVKGDWLNELVAREPWDLVACSFGESHCGGHQLLHLFDTSSPWHEPDTPPDLADALADIYAAIDASVAKVIEAAGPDALVILVASHGMSTYIGGYQLLEEFLARLWPAPIGRRLAAAPSHLPGWARGIAQAVVPAGMRRRRREVSGELHGPLTMSHTKAISVPNNRVGAIRLNVVGREPFGTVHPGAETDATIAEIDAALRELRQPASGELIVDDVRRADELFGPERHADLPDLIVTFRRDLGPLESCESPRVGRIDRPVRHPDLPRSGDHTDHARWWVRGAGLGAGSRPTEVSSVDLAPTVLAALGVEGQSSDGRPLDLASMI
jgi:predicted AlkP superfamily phosphohydrolase/phosphomutase